MNISKRILDFTEIFELELADLYKKLIPLGCTYLYYTISNPNTGRLRFNTNVDWMDAYLNESLIKYDPVKLACEQKTSRILVWNNLPIAEKNQKRVMQAREYYKIYNGVNFIEYDKFTHTHKILALCTDSKSHNFPKEIFNRMEYLNSILEIINKV